MAQGGALPFAVVRNTVEELIGYSKQKMRRKKTKGTPLQKFHVRVLAIFCWPKFLSEKNRRRNTGASKTESRSTPHEIISNFIPGEENCFSLYAVAQYERGVFSIYIPK